MPRHSRRPGLVAAAAVAAVSLATLTAACTPSSDRRASTDTAMTSGATPTTTAAATTPSAPAKPGVTRAPYGKLADGQSAELFTLTNAHGVQVQVTNYGGIVTSLRTPDRNGHLDDVVFGFDSLAGYFKDSPYFGAIVGRYANRIAKGQFKLDGATYTLAKNNGPNSLHGGLKGFDKVLWTADEPFQSDSGVGVRLHYTSPAGEEGYPGTLKVAVTYTLTPKDELVVDYEATTDKATPLNLSQHTYWNLHGNGKGNILDHVLTLDASHYTPVDSTLIPTGQIASVAGTPFDFRTPTAIGARIDQANDTQLKYGKGYDHNWVIDRKGNDATALVHAARLADPTTGRTLDVSTTEPGIQFYSGNFLDGKVTGKGGVAYPHRSAVALETQHFPDSPNHPNFPSTILRPGQTYKSRTVFTFGVAK